MPRRSTHSTMYREAFLQGYKICALWSSTDDNGNPLDNYPLYAIDKASETKMEADCDAFIAANRRDLSLIEPGQAGHDFWLTRNGHGAGFWDRGLEERGDRLTAACDKFGTCDLYVGDDGKIHCI